MCTLIGGFLGLRGRGFNVGGGVLSWRVGVCNDWRFVRVSGWSFELVGGV